MGVGVGMGVNTACGTAVSIMIFDEFESLTDRLQPVNARLSNAIQMIILNLIYPTITQRTDGVNALLKTFDKQGFAC